MEKDVETLCENMVNNDESIFLGCVINRKVYRLYNNSTQPIYKVQTKIAPHEYEDFDLIGLDMKHVCC